MTGRRGQSWDCAPPQIALTLRSTAPQAGKGEGTVAESTTLTSQHRATHQTPPIPAAGPHLVSWVRVLKSRERMERRTSMQPMY